MSGVVTAIFRYPVKGLSADPLERIEVAAGETLPFDRAWAIENGLSRFDPENPRHLPKICFLMLMRDERLAALEARFDAESQRLTLLRGGRQVATGLLRERSGRQILEQFLSAFMAESLRGPPRIVAAPGHSFTDTAAKLVHLVNLRTVQTLERTIGRPVDPLRFRPNLVIDGPDAHAELDWIGREIAIGSVRLKVTERTGRCAATNVDPSTGARDMDIPAIIQRKWGHTDVGVYAEILSPGPLSIGDAVSVST